MMIDSEIVICECPTDNFGSRPICHYLRENIANSSKLSEISSSPSTVSTLELKKLSITVLWLSLSQRRRQTHSAVEEVRDRIGLGDRVTTSRRAQSTLTVWVPPTCVFKGNPHWQERKHDGLRLWSRNCRSRCLPSSITPTLLRSLC